MSNHTDLNVLLEKIEEKASRAAMFLYGGNVSNAESAKDVPALVKALRGAVECLKWSLADDPGLLATRKAAITAILQASSEPKGEKEN